MNNKTLNTEKVLKILFNNPTCKFHIRELARITKLNPNTIINIIKPLEKQKIVEKQAKKHIIEISLNFENKETIWKKRIFNMSQIYGSGLVDFLIEKYSPSSICLIGSYSRGEDIEKSDIDIAVITNKKNLVNLNKFEKKLNKNIHLLLISKSNISEEFFNNLINGIRLYGYLKK